MKAVLPGKPAPRLQALTTGSWDSRRVIAYITGNALAILSAPDTLLQTIYDDDETPLEAVTLDEPTGCLAVCTDRVVRIYEPIDQLDGTVKWTLQSSFSPNVRGPNPDADSSSDCDSGSDAGSSASPMTLSWGTSGELLVGHASLALFRAGATPTCSWRRQLASPAKWAVLSYDSAYAACAGYTDRLVKAWRRLNFDSDHASFDFFYLPHPAAVTGLQWRRPYHVGHTVEHVLYTFCADNMLRIWTRSDAHSHTPQLLALWGAVDLAASLQAAVLKSSFSPNAGARSGTAAASPSAATAPAPWAFIIQGRDLAAATEQAVQERADSSDKSGAGALKHLVHIANRSSELCLVLDARGALVALSLENLDSAAQKTGDVYCITQMNSADLDFRSASSGSGSGSGFALRFLPASHIEITAFCDRGAQSSLHFLVHDISGGRVEVLAANVARLLDETAPGPRLWHKSTWAGHSAPLRKIVRNFSGSAVVSRTDTGETVIWHHTHGRRDTPLSPHSLLPTAGRPIHRICVLRQGRFVVLLFGDCVEAWDCRRQDAPVLLGRCDYTLPGEPLCLLVLPRQRAEDGGIAHLAMITSEKQGLVWEAVFPGYGYGEGGLCPFCRFDLPDAGDLAYVLPVDPAGTSPAIAGFLDVFARDVAISYTRDGQLGFWTARVDHAARRVDWLATSAIETGMAAPSLVSGSTRKKAALVNATRDGLTIWDIRNAQLEYAGSVADGSFAGIGDGSGDDRDGTGDNDSIRDLDWTSTPDSQSILAVGFAHRVLLLSQLRFDYLNKGPAWAVVRQIRIRASTPHPIGDSAWLGDGDLVIGAGNQLLIHGRRYHAPAALVAGLRLPLVAAAAPSGPRYGSRARLKPKAQTTWDLFEVVQRLNGPLPVFHPQFLSQCMLAGKTALVQRILLELHQILKFWVPGDTVDDYLGIDMEEFYTKKESFSHAAVDRTNGKGNSLSFLSRGDAPGDDEEVFSEEIAQAIGEKLTAVALPQLSGHEQIQLVDIVECAGEVEKQRRSMDENAARYMVFFRQNALRKGRTNEMHMSWREINWAFHSESQDILVDFVARQHHGSLLWADARESGLFMWLADTAAVKAQFEVVARNEYTKDDDKNPVHCSLYYLALRKKTVLQGLWRMASANREQRPTQRLLANNFNEPKWRTAALKNAYALMSKRRFEYAAAFFLLGDHLQDAVDVCFHKLKDLQLAIAIARVYEGDQGPVLRKFLEEEVLAVAAQEGNRWLASWAFWMLHRRDMAVRSLITPVYTLLETPCSPDIKSRLFLTDDPALVILYAQLRQMTLQTLRGASKVTPKVEWELVLHSARLYDRMGCDLLGLDLVRNWEFLLPEPNTAPGLGGDINPLRMLKHRSSLVVADLPESSIAEQLATAVKAGNRPQAPPKFVEPDANSLLDSFGF